MNFSSIKKFIITVSCIMILIGILIVFKFIINSKKNNKKENINNATAKEINEKSRYLKEDGRVITDEDYIITLEKYYYEADINIGHCLISVMENGKKGRDIYCVLEDKEVTGGRLSFGGTNIYNYLYYTDYLFELHPGTGGCCGEAYRKSYSDEDKKYIYFDFEIMMIGFKDTIVIKNKYKEELEVSFTSKGIGIFQLEDNTDWRDFTEGDNKISVCAYGVKINEGQAENITDFEIHMNNGEILTITGGDMREVKYKYKSPITQLRFEECIDINNISYIKWKGIKF